MSRSFRADQINTTGTLPDYVANRIRKQRKKQLKKVRQGRKFSQQIKDRLTDAED